MKKILIIYGHPLKESFCTALGNAYKSGAEEVGAEVRSFHIEGLDFDPVLHKGYTDRQQLEPDLLKAQEDIEWADHIVWVYPVWWGTMPGKMKGFIDRTFHPQWAFTFPPGKLFQKKLLKGRSARLITTMDNLPWLYKLRYLSPGHCQMKGMILKFCGIKPIRITSIGSVKLSSSLRRQKWLQKVEVLGRTCT